MNRRLLYGGLLTLLVAGVVTALFTEKPEEYEFPQPEEVVNQYFKSWAEKDYVNMYATISDGFKESESTASSLQNFKGYVGAQTIDDINIHLIKEESNYGETAVVRYDVTFLSQGESIPFRGKFTLKNRQGDVIRGWKLIHPYGDNIDRS